MLAQTPIVGFVPVRSLEAAEQFYCSRLGLKSRGSDGFALVLEAGNRTMIRCVAVNSVPQPFTILGWEVEDIDAAVQQLAAAGVKTILYPHFQQAENGVWTAPDGSRVAWFNDPFGNVLSLSRHAAAPR